MATKHDLRDWVIEALGALGGSGSVTAVSREVWDRHERELRESGDLFYTWQYDIRWAGQTLRNDQVLAPAPRGGGPWQLADQPKPHQVSSSG